MSEEGHLNEAQKLLVEAKARAGEQLQAIAAALAAVEKEKGELSAAASTVEHEQISAYGAAIAKADEIAGFAARAIGTSGHVGASIQESVAKAKQALEQEGAKAGAQKTQLDEDLAAAGLREAELRVIHEHVAGLVESIQNTIESLGAI